MTHAMSAHDDIAPQGKVEPALPTKSAPAATREALEAAERQLINLARPICSVYNRATKKYEFGDEHISNNLPGTWAVIQQIRGALTDPAPALAASQNTAERLPSSDAAGAGAGAVSECELAKILAYQEWPFAPVDARRYWAENEWRRWVRQARDILSNYDVRRRG